MHYAFDLCMHANETIAYNNSKAPTLGSTGSRILGQSRSKATMTLVKGFNKPLGARTSQLTKIAQKKYFRQGSQEFL